MKRISLVALLLMLAGIVLGACSNKSAENGQELSSEEIAALRPTAPAGLDEDFRADAAALVANTGKPQLLEFFAYW